MDFLHDQPATGHKMRVLTVVDTFSRFSPGARRAAELPGGDVVRTLDRVCSIIGYRSFTRRPVAMPRGDLTMSICGLD
jgi:putative transposase